MVVCWRAVGRYAALASRRSAAHRPAAGLWSGQRVRVAALAALARATRPGRYGAPTRPVAQCRRGLFHRSGFACTALASSASPGGDLHQGWWVRLASVAPHCGRTAARRSSRPLGAHRLVDQPGAELEEHQPQVDSIRVEVGAQRSENASSSSSVSTRASSAGNRSSSSGSTDSTMSAGCRACAAFGP